MSQCLEWDWFLVFCVVWTIVSLLCILGVGGMYLMIAAAYRNARRKGEWVPSDPRPSTGSPTEPDNTARS